MARITEENFEGHQLHFHAVRGDRGTVVYVDEV